MALESKLKTRGNLFAIGCLVGSLIISPTINERTANADEDDEEYSTSYRQAFIHKYGVEPKGCPSLVEFDHKIWPGICEIGRVRDVKNHYEILTDRSDIYFDDGRMVTRKLVKGIMIGKFNVIYNCRGPISDAYVVPDNEVHCWNRVSASR